MAAVPGLGGIIMTTPRIVFLHGLRQGLVDLILTACPNDLTTVAVDGKLPPEQQIEAVHDADFLIVYRAKLPEPLLRSLKKARLIQMLAAGYDGVNLPLLRELRIPCANNGGANSWAVADQTVLMILALYRRFLVTDREVREGKWNAGIDGLNTYELAGKNVGIVGLGNIGKKVARRVQAFDARVQYFNRTRLPAGEEQALDVQYMPLDDLVRNCDVLSLHVPLTADTRRLISRERLGSMKRSAILINTSRGEVVDEQALTELLGSGGLAGAGIDAFEKEPVEASNPLLALGNVVLAPHSAGTTADTWLRRARFAYANIRRVLDGQPPEAAVKYYD